MKTKSIRKALEINKVTIVNLDHNELRGINGGKTALSDCPPCPVIHQPFSTDRDCSVFVCEISVIQC